MSVNIKELLSKVIKEDREEEIAKKYWPNTPTGSELEEQASVEGWQYDNAREYVKKLIEVTGPPKYITGETAVWKNIAGFDRVIVRDESVPHEFPAKHIDFVYSTKKIEVPPELHDDLANVTGSIIIDGLKGEVTARCGSIVANAVTLGFVEDVVKGSTEPTKDEYARRIMNHITPPWFEDILGEKKEGVSEVELIGTLMQIVEPAAVDMGEKHLAWKEVISPEIEKEEDTLEEDVLEQYLYKLQEQAPIPTGGLRNSLKKVNIDQAKEILNNFRTAKFSEMLLKSQKYRKLASGVTTSEIKAAIALSLKRERRLPNSIIEQGQTLVEEVIKNSLPEDAFTEDQKIVISSLITSVALTEGQSSMSPVRVTVKDYVLSTRRAVAMNRTLAASIRYIIEKGLNNFTEFQIKVLFISVVYLLTA